MQFKKETNKSTVSTFHYTLFVFETQWCHSSFFWFSRFISLPNETVEGAVRPNLYCWFHKCVVVSYWIFQPNSRWLTLVCATTFLLIAAVFICCHCGAKVSFPLCRYSIVISQTHICSTSFERTKKTRQTVDWAELQCQDGERDGGQRAKNVVHTQDVSTFLQQQKSFILKIWKIWTR